MAYDMYQEIILQHYKAPRNFGPMEHPDLSGEESNPNCGDRITMDLRLDAGRTRIDEVRFHGEGCAICIASASMLTQKLKGSELAAARSMQQDDVLKMVGIPLSPVRIKCALTGFAAFGRAVSGPATEARTGDDWTSGGSTSG